MALSKPRDWNTLEKIGTFIWQYDMPKLLIYGDSHMVRLEEWLNKPMVETDKFGPKPLDHKALEHIEFCAVGGTTFETIHSKVAESRCRRTKEGEEINGNT